MITIDYKVTNNGIYLKPNFNQFNFLIFQKLKLNKLCLPVLTHDLDYSYLFFFHHFFLFFCFLFYLNFYKFCFYFYKYCFKFIFLFSVNLFFLSKTKQNMIKC